MSDVFGIRHSRNIIDGSYHTLEETFFPMSYYSFCHNRLPKDELELVHPVNVAYERMKFRYAFSNELTVNMLKTKRNRLSFKVVILSQCIGI
jgi:hypothetical protein